MSHLRKELPDWPGLGDIRGRVWLPPTPQHPAPALAVVQGANATSATHRVYGGRYVQIRAYVIPRDPKTPRQLAARQRLRDATAAWRAATLEERRTATAAARKRRIGLYHAWIAAYLAAHPLPAATTWDDGTTTWDAGTTTWD